MNGEVDSSGRALILLNVRRSESAAPTGLVVWLDTAFTGELVVPHQTVEKPALPQWSAVLAGLADGTEVVLETYTCELDWFGEKRLVEVIENDGEFPLLGVGLLRDRKLQIDYRSRSLVID